jgi:hypothetical protein
MIRLGEAMFRGQVRGIWLAQDGRIFTDGWGWGWQSVSWPSPATFRTWATHTHNAALVAALDQAQQGR